MNVLADALESTLTVTAVLETLGVSYVVGGSVASSLLGIPRMTNDADLVAAMRDEHVEPFARSLEADFYVDRDMIREAIRTRREFNVIDNRNVFKVDVFVPALDLVTRRELSRGARQVLADGRSLVVASAEDVIVQKLKWFQLGGEVARRQYEDAAGVLRTGGAQIDRAYLDETAELLGVTGLLARLVADALG